MPRIWIYFSFIGIIKSTFKNTLSLIFISMQRIAPYFAALFAALILSAICMAQRLSADLVITNANIHTMDDKRTVARSMAVLNGKIIAIGSDGDIKSLIGANTQVIDAKGKL